MGAVESGMYGNGYLSLGERDMDLSKDRTGP